MSLISYKQIRDEAVVQIGTAFKQWKLKSEAHPGKFDEAEVRRLAMIAPAILTSLIRVKDESADNQALDFVSWVLVRADNKDQLFDQALNTLSVLIPLLRGIDAPWSHGGAEGVEATNLYTSSSAGINLSMWAVSWSWPLRQTVVITPQEAAGEVPPSVDDPFFGGGVLLPDQLGNFKGADGKIRIGTQDVDVKFDE